jgi:hypothetical protein
VVVDPVSQFPQAAPFPSSSHRTAEPTRILSSRKIDELRAQVLVHRRQARRKKTLQFVSWGLAGALALAAGGILAGGILPLMESMFSDDPASEGLDANRGIKSIQSGDADALVKVESQATVSAASSAAPPSMRAEPAGPGTQAPATQAPATQVQKPTPDPAQRAVSLEELEQESGEAE